MTPRNPQSGDARGVLAARPAPEFAAALLAEPALAFSGGEESADPRVGLGAFGPGDARPGERRTVRIGVIGTAGSIERAGAWLERCRGPVRSGAAGPPFPGLGGTFAAEFAMPPALSVVLADGELARADAAAVVEMVGARLRALASASPPPDVVLVALPHAVRARCAGPGPGGGRHSLEYALRARAAGSAGLATQFLWEGAGWGDGGDADASGHAGDDDAARAWDFWTGLYFRAGGRPWRAAGLDPESCFVGVSYYREPGGAPTARGLAQVFGAGGDGVVVRGGAFQWDGASSPQAPRGAAASLMGRAIGAHAAARGAPPRRVVVHKARPFGAGERAGFAAAFEAAAVGAYDLVALGERGIRFFRAGPEPPARGTFIDLRGAGALLYTRGHVASRGPYDGPRVPAPLEIAVDGGGSAARRVAEEVLVLTKMDWARTDPAARLPVTTAAAAEVAHVVARLSQDAPPGGWPYRLLV